MWCISDIRDMCRSIVVIVLLALSVNAALVTIEQGTLSGTYLEARNGEKFNAFYGIPYAEPPVGKLRFKAPVEAKPWSGVWNASITPERCLQVKTGASYTEGSEDCLYLNVYTPLNAQKGANLSVIAYIFGGVFKNGSNTHFGPDYIMGSNVILVMPNYRLGALGFLSTGDTVIPGNFGLKDQNMALKWIQKNIYNFGGDPNKVTLYGHSSGAVCVHLHTLSPQSKGLFQQVIMQSGFAFCPSSFFGRDVPPNVAREFALRAGCEDVKSSEKILECLISMNASLMPIIQEEMYIWSVDPDAAFRPTVEDKSVPDAFLTDMPGNMEYHSPHLPLIIGLTTGECAGRVTLYLSNDGVLAEELDQDYKLILPITIQYLWDTKSKHLDYISQVVRTHYFGNEKISAATAKQMVDMFTHGVYGLCTMDTIFSYPGLKYVYWYDYVSNYTVQAGYGEYLGISHADDIQLFFYRSPAVKSFTDQDIMFSKELIKRWLNFVNSGNPNIPEKINETMMSIWKPAETDRIEYLRIDLNGSMQTDLYNGTYQFWKRLPIGSKYFHYYP